ASNTRPPGSHRASAHRRSPLRSSRRPSFGAASAPCLGAQLLPPLAQNPVAVSKSAPLRYPALDRRLKRSIACGRCIGPHALGHTMSVFIGFPPARCPFFEETADLTFHRLGLRPVHHGPWQLDAHPGLPATRKCATPHPTT